LFYLTISECVAKKCHDTSIQTSKRQNLLNHPHPNNLISRLSLFKLLETKLVNHTIFFSNEWLNLNKKWKQPLNNKLHYASNTFLLYSRRFTHIIFTSTPHSKTSTTKSLFITRIDMQSTTNNSITSATLPIEYEWKINLSKHLFSPMNPNATEFYPSIDIHFNHNDDDLMCSCACISFAFISPSLTLIAERRKQTERNFICCLIIQFSFSH
jgi:hypothetical protein